MCFPDLFVVTKEKFGQIDIVVNNAGIMNEAKDMLMIDINVVRISSLFARMLLRIFSVYATGMIWYLLNLCLQEL